LACCSATATVLDEFLQTIELCPAISGGVDGQPSITSFCDLPHVEIDTTRTTATLKAGILELRMPKIGRAQATRVEVKNA